MKTPLEFDRSSSGHPSESGLTARPRPRRGSPLLGRLWVLVFFGLFYGCDAYLYLHTALDKRTDRLSSIIVSNVWTTVLLIGVLARYLWARYLLGVVIVVRMIWEAMPISSLLNAPQENLEPLVRIGAFLAIYAFTLWVLIASRDLRRLTHRT